MRRAVAALGGTVETLECEYTGPQASELSRQLLSRAELPTAVVYASDVMALAGMAVASELGVRVPAQLSVVSWDDSHLTTLVHPSVTALWRDTPGYGATAASVLLDLVEGRHRGRTQMPPSTLRVRETTGPAPRS